VTIRYESSVVDLMSNVTDWPATPWMVHACIYGPVRDTPDNRLGSPEARLPDTDAPGAIPPLVADATGVDAAGDAGGGGGASTTAVVEVSRGAAVPETERVYSPVSPQAYVEAITRYAPVPGNSMVSRALRPLPPSSSVSADDSPGPVTNR
jgi:hypothetical protein